MNLGTLRPAAAGANLVIARDAPFMEASNSISVNVVVTDTSGNRLAGVGCTWYGNALCDVIGNTGTDQFGRAMASVTGKGTAGSAVFWVETDGCGVAQGDIQLEHFPLPPSTLTPSEPWDPRRANLWDLTYNDTFSGYDNEIQFAINVWKGLRDSQMREYIGLRWAVPEPDVDILIEDYFDKNDPVTAHADRGVVHCNKYRMGDVSHPEADYPEHEAVNISTIVHELGHVFELGHNFADPASIMWGGGSSKYWKYYTHSPRTGDEEQIFTYFPPKPQ